MKKGSRYGILIASGIVLGILFIVLILKENIDSMAHQNVPKQTKMNTADSNNISNEMKMTLDSELNFDKAQSNISNEGKTAPETEEADKAENNLPNEGKTALKTDKSDKVQGNLSNEAKAILETESFYYTELTEEIKMRITGISYPDTEEPLQITYDDLAYVHVLHYDFDGEVQHGELICNKAIAQDLVDIFRQLYDSQYPIEKICLIDAYDGDDETSMMDNNTSCFNYRTVSGSSKLSKHSYGLAVDINPLYNPYVKTRNGKTLVSPENGIPYADRSEDFLYKIDTEDLCYQLFIQHGFSWGGAWKNSKDYQHFEKENLKEE